MRFCTHGSRTVVLACSSQVREYMEKTGVTGANPENIQSFFKGMSKEVVDAFTAAGGKLHHATIGQGEALVLPFNYMMAERTAAGGDHIGLRVSFWLKSDEEKMMTTSRWLISIKRASTWLQSALDAIVEEAS